MLIFVSSGLKLSILNAEAAGQRYSVERTIQPAILLKMDSTMGVSLHKPRESKEEATMPRYSQK